MNGYKLQKGSKTYNTVMGTEGAGIKGNILPPQWLKHLTRTGKNGAKPYTTAAVILSDIVYWYRPILDRDEETGQPLPPRKKFKADKLQRSYQQLADMYGYTKRQVKDACHYLASLDIIDLDFRTITTASGQKIGNVLFVGLDFERVRVITHDIPYDEKTLQGGYDEKAVEVSRKNGTAITEKRHTNTENTTEISTEIKEEEGANLEKIRSFLISEGFFNDYASEMVEKYNKAGYDLDSVKSSIRVQIASLGENDSIGLIHYRVMQGQLEPPSAEDDGLMTEEEMQAELGELARLVREAGGNGEQAKQAERVYRTTDLSLEEIVSGLTFL